MLTMLYRNTYKYIDNKNKVQEKHIEIILDNNEVEIIIDGVHLPKIETWVFDIVNKAMNKYQDETTI